MRRTAHAPVLSQLGSPARRQELVPLAPQLRRPPEISPTGEFPLAAPVARAEGRAGPPSVKVDIGSITVGRGVSRAEVKEIEDALAKGLKRAFANRGFQAGY
jgi:hypothetical protein